MPAEQDPYARRLSLLETNLSGQATALKALLGAFETLSSSLAKLTEELDDADDAEDIFLRVSAIEFRQQQLICVVRDMHNALGTLFRGLSEGTTTFEKNSQELAELADEASEALGDVSG